MGALPLQNGPSDMEYLFRTLSAAGRKAITRKWLKPEMPTVDDWIDIIYNTFMMERITFSIRLQQDKLLKRWENWIEYIKPI